MTPSDLTLEQIRASSETSGPDHRLHRRYPIRLAAEFRLLTRGQVTQRGVGTTLNISSGGLLLESSDHLPLGCKIKVSIQWPFLLDGVRPLKLGITGRIVRTGKEAVAIQIGHHEFRTARLAPSNSASRSESRANHAGWFN